MLIPTKHEDLNKNLLVLGADILRYLKGKEDLTIEEVFQYFKARKQISMDRFFDTITYLWLLEFVLVQDFKIFINKK